MEDLRTPKKIPPPPLKSHQPRVWRLHTHRIHFSAQPHQPHPAHSPGSQIFQSPGSRSSLRPRLPSLPRAGRPTGDSQRMLDEAAAGAPDWESGKPVPGHSLATAALFTGQATIASGPYSLRPEWGGGWAGHWCADHVLVGSLHHRQGQTRSVHLRAFSPSSRDISPVFPKPQHASQHSPQTKH